MPAEALGARDTSAALSVAALRQIRHTEGMDVESNFISKIHDSGAALVLAVTGGGSLSIGRLLAVPGASRSVLGAIVPYSGAALRSWLNATPEHYCEPYTARLMAMTAFTRARGFASADKIDARLLGLGCTASLASDRPKRGAHRAHVAWQSLDATVTWSLELEKGARTRAEEESLVADLVLNAVAEGAGVAERLPLALRAGERVVERRTRAPESWRELVFGDGAPVGVGPATSEAPLLFPGAFHPLHAGHRGMAEVARKKLGKPAQYELSVRNVDKPPLDFTEIEDRVAQLRADEAMWLTSAPTFVEKGRLFPGATFVVGLDTVTRIGEARYYGESESACAEAIAELGRLGCRFLVFGRKCGERFETLADAVLPAALRGLCAGVGEGEFRLDISSTELRRRDAGETDASG